MHIMTFVLIWMLLSFPIVHNVNNKLKEAGEEFVYKTDFQIFLFLRAQFEVPRFYLMVILYLIIPKQK